MIMQQKQLSKQSQLIDQGFSNGIMLNAIAALENLAFFYGYKGKRLFDYYSGYANRKSEKELIDAIIIQLDIFRASHFNYSSIYENYDFPKNLSKEQIINIIYDWSKQIPGKNKIFYQEIINYLNGYSNVSGISGEINKRKKEWGQTTKADLERIGRSAPYINSQMFNQIDIIKESYKKNEEYEIIANLNKNRDDDIEMKKLIQYEQNFSKHEIDFYNVEKKIETFFENLFLNQSLKNSDIEEIKNLVIMFKKLINGIPMEEMEYKQKINNYKCCKKNIKENIKDKAVSNFFCSICDEIISCYQRNFSSIC